MSDVGVDAGPSEPVIGSLPRIAMRKLSIARPVSSEVATLSAMGNRASSGEALALSENVLGRKAVVRHQERPRGHERETGADTARARAELAFAPSVSLRERLARQVAWARAR